MIARGLTLACPMILCMSAAGFGAEGPRSYVDPSAQVQAIFSAKCSECHGPRVPRPKGGVTLHDPAKVAANPNIVTPGNLERSALWEVVENGEMPPDYARAGPLRALEKEAIRRWIESLPPPIPSTDAESTVSSPGHPSLLAWLGRFHILVIHFPIALLTAAAVAEVMAALKRSPTPEPIVRFCVLQGAAGAAVAVALGWLHAVGHPEMGGVLTLHRWLGTSTGLCTAVTAIVSEQDWRRGRRSVLFRVLLASSALLVAATAHLGGMMTHGERFFDW